MTLKKGGVILGIVTAIVLFLSWIVGPGGFKRMVTVSGIYAVECPKPWACVCILDSDGHEGGLSCLPKAWLKEDAPIKIGPHD